MKPIKQIYTSSSRRFNNRRQGSALIMTMAMLTLIVVFFMSFAVMAIYNHKNAKMSESLIQARLHSQTGLNDLYGELSSAWENPNTDNLYPATRYSSTSHPTNIGCAPQSDGRRFFWYSKGSGNDGLSDALKTTIAGKDFLEFSDVSSVEWQNIASSDGSAEIVGRIAYVIIDESGKVDPTAAVDSDVADDAETRLGTHPSELSLKYLFDASGLGERLQPEKHGGLMPDTAMWMSYYHIIKSIGSTGTNKELVSNTIFPFSKDIEAFNTDSADDSLPTAMHRFDLSTVDWNAFNNVLDTSVFDSPAVEYWDETGGIAPNVDGGIPWFHYAADEDVKKQVLANLIDYCDKEDSRHEVPTTDYDGTTISYIGLEDVPYINEVLFYATIIKTTIVDPATPSDSGNIYEFGLSAVPELINCYADDFTSALKVEIKFQATWKDVGAGTTIEKADLSQTYAIPSVPGRSYYSPASASWLAETFSEPITQLAGDINLPLDMSLDDFNVTLTSVTVIDGSGKLLDYAITDATTPEATTKLLASSERYISIEADDPRANFKTEHWTWGNAWDPVSADTLGLVNLACLPYGGDYDREDYAVPPPDGIAPAGVTAYPFALDTTNGYGVSTMYIRNGPIESLWELGCIHRGTPWQTINLHTYYAAAGTETGMGAWAAGDANILGQVKLTEDLENSGRINVNSPHANVIKTLLYNIPIDGTYADPAGSGTTLTEKMAEAVIGDPSTPASLLVGEWFFNNGSTAWNGGLNGEPFTNRGQIALVQNMSNGTVYTAEGKSDIQITDMAKEEIIGKVVNLCTTRPNYFTAIIVSQVIKDHRGKGTIGTYDAGTDKILAEQKTMAILHRDGYTNQFKVLRLEYLE